MAEIYPYVPEDHPDRLQWELVEGLRWAFQYDQRGWWDAMCLFGLVPEAGRG